MPLKSYRVAKMRVKIPRLLSSCLKTIFCYLSYIVVDGAMTEVLRPALYDAYHHIDLAEASLSPDQHSLFDIVGPVCESADFLGKVNFTLTTHSSE